MTPIAHITPADTRHTRALIYAVLLLACLPFRASAAAALMVLHGDFQQSVVQAETIDAAGLHGADAAGKPVDIPLASLIAADHADRRPVISPASLVLLVEGGLCLPGEAAAMDGESVRWKSPSLGTLRVPLTSVLAIVRGTSQRRLAPGREDMVRLANGDSLRGAIASADATHLKFQTESGEAAVPWASVAELSLAQTPGDRPATATTAADSYRIELGDGSTWLATDVSLADGKIKLRPTGGEAVQVAAGDLRALERQGGRVTWLVRQAPTRAQQVPFLAHAAPQPVFTVLGATQAGGERFRTAVRVIPKSRLTYAIPPGVTHFRTRFAQQKEGKLANVTLRIYADDKLLLEQPGVSSAAPEAPVTLPLAGARELSLEVDYGANFDVEDSLLWLDPAFVRSGQP